MCFYTVSVERTPEGRLVQTRPRAARPVRELPPARAIQQQLPYQNPDFVDQFTGVIPSPPSSDDSEQSGQKASKSKNKASAKDQVKQSSQPNTATAQVASSKSVQKKTQSLPKHIRSGFAPATIKSSPIVQLQRPDSPPTPKKKVNFAARDQLTRGKDKSYSPPPGPRKVRFSPEFISDDTSSEDEDTTKQVRFSEKLIRGEGTGYNNLAPKASERYPYASRAFQPSRLRRNVSPSALKEPRSKLKRPASPIRTPSPPSPINTMRRSNFYKKYPLPYGQFNESDIDNDDSDDSFSDIVAEEAAAVEMKRHQPPLKNPLNPLKAPPDRRPESTRQPARPTRAHGILQSVADTEDSYVADVTSANTRRNSVSGQPTAGGVPTHNRQGHRIRASYDANAFDGRRQPVFVLRSTSGNSAPARPQPVFVSRGSGGAHRRSSSDTTSNRSQKHGSRRGQESSDEDEEGEVDDGIHYDPGRGVTYLDV